jgi:8-oxo-dGTP pyrophosphatase MutT (NUDIX family)
VNSVVSHDHPEPDQVPVRDASTVMLLRDGADGIEVCLMQRNLDSDFVGGAYVFPGGAVDPEDGEPATTEMCTGRDDADASRLLDVPSGALAYWVAAIRESFEEAGILLARTAAGEPVSFHDPEVALRFERHRLDVDHGRRRIADVAREEGLRLDVGALHYFSRWITPLGAHRRYDTRFFVAAAPEGQVALHDDRELIGTHWLTPVEAIRRHDAGELVMIFPTIRSLVALQRFERSADVLEYAAMLSRVPAVLPTVTESASGTRIVLPGDPEDTGGVYDATSARPIDG